MKKFAVMSALVMSMFGCSDEDSPYTFGEYSLELGTMYCSALRDCGYVAPDDVEVCADHVRWHNCEPDSSCNMEVDERRSNDLLNFCEPALTGLQPDDEVCFLLGWGFVPDECVEAVKFRAVEPEAPAHGRADAG